MGGFAAQEAIISLTGKFSPLRQWVRKARERVGREGGRERERGRDRGREGGRSPLWEDLLPRKPSFPSLGSSLH